MFANQTSTGWWLRLNLHVRANYWKRENKSNHVAECFVCRMTSNQLGFTFCPLPSDSKVDLALGDTARTLLLACLGAEPHSVSHFRLHQSVQYQVSRLRFPRGGWWQIYRSPGAYLARHLLHLCSMFLAWGSGFLRRGRRDQVGQITNPLHPFNWHSNLISFKSWQIPWCLHMSQLSKVLLLIIFINQCGFVTVHFVKDSKVL